MNKKVVSLILGVMCLILTYGICIQIKTINSTNSSISTNATENSLRDQILRYKERYDQRYKELEDAEITLEKERENSVSSDATLAQKEDDIKEANKILGLTEVTGPGVIIELADAPISSNTLDVSSLLVHDLDIQNVVNELKNAGAEAISINGQRVVPTTAITCSGNIIQVNGEKIGSPFEIKAIGLPEQLAGLERPGGCLDIIDDYGITADLKKSNNVTIEKYTGVINFKYAKNQN